MGYHLECFVVNLSLLNLVDAFCFGGAMLDGQHVWYGSGVLEIWQRSLWKLKVLCSVFVLCGSKGEEETLQRVPAIVCTSWEIFLLRY